ncbi:hypothetical protein PDESU_02419 [Pontiella desulfatans]|uniref:VWFA domain-containing protein n=1 Tax=Pontiella desulfatans TaxID=2750659 RepID=A0A6C2U1N1_PONDE|nr:hypothetical protein [Pontiella desulfatans]VGO13862.1 hypothetical protein PDESU_02419 [Pontiella desulfatans]
MSGSQKKRFFAQHAKSSAALVSLGIHAILLVVALSFVAVTVITKEEQKFETKNVNRPRMPMKKLQVPVNIKKKKTQKPKLRKRIVVQPKLNQNMPDIKMPEITGVKGGIGGGVGDGLGGGGGVGFSMPEIEIFGVKSKGEKIFVILDSTAWMMYDEIGGIPAYTVIKEELVNILGGLSPTVLFNIAVFDNGSAVSRFPKMVPANSVNVGAVDEWIRSLNAVKKGMGDKDYGNHTLGSGGTRLPREYTVAPLQHTRHWSTPAMLAMEQQADTVFILTQGWGWQFHETADAKQWSESKMAKWRDLQEQAKQKLKEENEERRKKGEPPRVLIGWSLVSAYFPGAEHPPQPERYWYTPKEMLEGLSSHREANKSNVPTTSGLGKRSQKKEKFSINVIHFVRKDHISEKDQDRFKKLTAIANGSYKTLSGLEAIQSSASGR